MEILFVIMFMQFIIVKIVKLNLHTISLLYKFHVIKLKEWTQNMTCPIKGYPK